MGDCTSVTIGGTLIIDGVTADADGTVWDALSLNGWWDSATPKLELAELQPVGQVATLARLETRVVAAEFLARHAVNGQPLGNHCFVAMRTIKKAVAKAWNVPVLMQVTDPDLSLQSYVRLAMPLKSTIEGELGAVQFSVPITCTDPRRFTQATVTTPVACTGTGTDSGGITVTNAGDIETPAVVTIGGPATNPRIQNDSMGSPAPYVLYDGTLGGGDTLVIDLDAQTVLLNGGNAIQNVDVASQFWQLQPGGNVVHYSRSGGGSTSTASFTFRSAYQ